MWIDGLSIKDLFAHRQTRIEFDRAHPVSLFLGRNGHGKTTTAQAVEIGLSGGMLAAVGSGVPLSDIAIREGASAGVVSLTIRPSPTAKPVEIRRRITARGVTTTVNGSASTKDSTDLFLRVHGDADPLTVLSVLCNATGFFDLDRRPQDLARKQIALLTGLIDPSVPADAFPNFPPSLGPAPLTFPEIEAAYDLVSTQLTAANREYEALAPDGPALDPVDDAEIAAIEEKLAALRKDRDDRVEARGDSAGRRVGLEDAKARLTEALDRAGVRLAELGTIVAAGQRLGAAVAALSDAEAAEQARQGVVEAARALRGDLEGAIKVTREVRERLLAAQGQVSGRREALERDRVIYARKVGDAQAILAKLGSLTGSQRQLVKAQEALQAAEAREQARQGARDDLTRLGGILTRLRAESEALAKADAACSAPVCPLGRDATTQTKARESLGHRITAVEEEIAAVKTSMPSALDFGPLRWAVQDAVARTQDIERQTKARDEAQAALTTATEALAGLPPDDPEIPRLAERIQGWEAEIAAAESAIPKGVNLDRLRRDVQGAERAERAVAEIADQTQARDEAQAALATTEATLTALPADDPEIAVLAARLLVGAARLEEAKAAKRAYESAAATRAERQRLLAVTMGLDALRTALGPKGVRQRLLVERLGNLTTRVNAVLTYFGLSLSFQHDPWQVLLNGNALIRWSETQRLRAGHAFQLALSAVTGAGFVVVDRISNLDFENRHALFDVLNLGLAKGYIEQALLFGTYASEAPPPTAPADNVALFAVAWTATGGTTIARTA